MSQNPITSACKLASNGLYIEDLVTLGDYFNNDKEKKGKKNVEFVDVDGNDAPGIDEKETNTVVTTTTGMHKSHSAPGS
uniref:Uncharacterized protein n=1 Tax=Echinococcus granulosus TaxID=6210 RepID=A0A068X0U3_ECHGR|nr:hypothetical protein EgrG_002042300 [Echinococcus granulosus]